MARDDRKGLQDLLVKGISSRISDSKVTKDAMDFLSDQGNKQRDQMVKAAMREIRGFLEDIDVEAELRNIAQNFKLSISVELSLDERDPKNLSKATAKVETTTISKAGAAKKTSTSKSKAKTK